MLPSLMAVRGADCTKPSFTSIIITSFILLEELNLPELREPFYGLVKFTETTAMGYHVTAQALGQAGVEFEIKTCP